MSHVSVTIIQNGYTSIDTIITDKNETDGMIFQNASVMTIPFDKLLHAILVSFFTLNSKSNL
jgi:hypothetical protein